MEVVRVVVVGLGGGSTGFGWRGGVAIDWRGCDKRAMGLKVEDVKNIFCGFLLFFLLFLIFLIFFKIG
jgi:hypothetical protein